MMIEAEVKFVQRHLVGTLDKKATLKMLREWREETKEAAEADVLGDLIREVDSGALDG